MHVIFLLHESINMIKNMFQSLKLSCVNKYHAITDGLLCDTVTLTNCDTVKKVTKIVFL